MMQKQRQDGNPEEGAGVSSSASQVYGGRAQGDWTVDTAQTAPGPWLFSPPAADSELTQGGPEPPMASDFPGTSRVAPLSQSRVRDSRLLPVAVSGRQSHRRCSP